MIALTAGRIEWKPLPKQRVFLNDYRGVDEVLYGGAAGGAKSEAALIFSFLRRMDYPGSSGLILRRTYPELARGDGLIPRSHDLFTGVGHWSGEQRTWTFSNKSVIEFGHMVNDDSWRLYFGGGWEDVVFEELTQFSEQQYLMVGMGRARSVIPGCKPKVRATTNPGSTGHVWVRQRFIEPLAPLKIGWFARRHGVDTKLRRSEVEATPEAKSRAFIPSRLEDNPYLFDSGDYEANLAALPDDDYRALRHGDWYAWSGQVFKRWRQDRHVIEPRRLAGDVPRWAGLDWGYSSPFVCLVFAAGDRLPSDPAPKKLCDKIHVYVTQEITLTQKLDEEQRDICVQRIDNAKALHAWNADPASFFQTSRETGMRPSDWWARGGVLLTPSNNDRLMGKRAVDAFLSDCSCGQPWLRVFGTCENLIRTLPSLGYDEKKVEDVAKSDIDHHYDALRYGLMGLVPHLGDSGHGSEREISGRHA